MQNRENRTSLAEAVQDLQVRTLAPLRGDMAKLVYLASTRDYLTGHYYHDGLAFRFNEPVAELALALSHHEVFDRITEASFHSLVQEMELFLQTTRAEPSKVVAIWKNLQPYRMLIPGDCDRIACEFFFSNLKMALAVLQDRLARGSQG
jgi:hypothetical protein